MHVGGRGGGGPRSSTSVSTPTSPHSAGVEPGQNELERWRRSHSSGTGWRRRRRRRARRGRVTLEGCSGDDVVLSAEQGEAYKRLAARINAVGACGGRPVAAEVLANRLVARGRHRRLDDWAERMLVSSS